MTGVLILGIVCAAILALWACLAVGAAVCGIVAALVEHYSRKPVASNLPPNMPPAPYLPRR